MRKSALPLVAATVRTTVDNVSQTFRDFAQPDPRLDEGGKTSRLLQQQYKGYKETDPNEKHEKAIPLSVLRRMHSQSLTDLDRAIADLCIGAVFFCMRSCEYSKVSNQDDRKTKLLCLRNIRFFKDNSLIPQNSPSLDSASLISITFEDQKNRDKNESINLHRSSDPTLCPVKAWARTISRIWSYKGSSPNTPVNDFRLNGKKYQITNYMIVKSLRTTVESMSNENLGFSKEEIGTHSIRLGGAMALCLAKVEVYAVKIIGRWKRLFRITSTTNPICFISSFNFL